MTVTQLWLRVVTKKQEQFIKRLLKDFPYEKELFEYSDYLQTPNRGTVSAFIATALDTHLHEVESESGYMSYIARRLRRARTVYMYLRDRGDAQRKSWPSIKTIAADLRLFAEPRRGS